MALLLNLIFSLAFAGAMGGAVHFWRVHLDTARREGMQALAARRGWALTLTGETLGRAGTLRLAPRGGHPWVAEARPGNGQPRGPVTEYEADEPRWADGTLVMVTDGPTGSRVLPASPPSGPSPSGLRTQALREMLGDDVARLVGQFESIPAPAGMTALATGDPTHRVDLQDLARVMEAFVPVASGPRGRPVLTLSPDGMRLRLRCAIRRPDQMERFLDLAFELSRLIGP